MNPIVIPWKTHYYYRNRLTGLDRMIYDRIFDGLQHWAKQIPVPYGCNINHVHSIYTMVVRDFPMFFHVGWNIRLAESPIPIKPSFLLPVYRLTMAEYDKQYRQVCDFVERSTRQLQGARRTYDKIRSIHNSMARHVIYFGLEEDDSHNVIGAILKRKAVCESIAKAFKLICDANYIPCIVIFGHATSTDGRQYGTVADEDNSANHAWNQVKIGETWYNIDVTYDLTVSGFEDKSHIRYDYFCRSDRVFSINHRPHGTFLPPSPKDHSYYKATGCYVKDLSGVRQLIRNAMTLRKEWTSFEYDLAMGLDIDTLRQILNSETLFGVFRSWEVSQNPKIGVVTIHMKK